MIPRTSLTLLALAPAAALAIAVPNASHLIRVHQNPRPRLQAKAVVYNRQTLAQAQHPVLGGRPQTTQEGHAWGVTEAHGQSCRVALGTAKGGAVVTVTVTKFDASDCVTVAGDAAEAARTLAQVLP